VHALPTAEVPEMPFFKSLGSEPLRDLTLERFMKLLQRKTPIKLLLMDQTKIAGIGNIYANDALYLAKIHPKRPAENLTKKEAKVLFEAIEKVLQKGIEVGGASEWHYVDVLGGKGQYQNFFLVYRKHNTPCPRCGTLLETVKMGGRGTFFCKNCQI
jgi:formamidopyrimidine-DNA glycosylase